MNISFYLNNNKVNPPYNWRELVIELNYDRDKNNVDQQASITDWEFVRENADFIIDYIEQGTNGGVGVFEGIPLRIEVQQGQEINILFDGYLDLSDGAKLSEIRSTVKAKERNSIDFINETADGFTFEYLKEIGVITKNDYVFVPYVLNSVPDYLQSAMATIGVFVIIKEIRDSSEKIKELAASLTNQFEATAIIRAVLLIGYLIILISTLIKLLNDLIKLIIQPVKYHAGMKALTLLQKGCQHLGFTFKSEILESDLYSKMVIIPEKFNNPPDKIQEQILGYLIPNRNLQEGFYKGTLGDLLRAMKQLCNAKIIVTENKEVILIRRDKDVNTPQYQLPPLYEPYYYLNTNEFNANYRIAFQYDVSDKNTIQEYRGTSYQVIAEPKAINNKELVLMKGFKQVDIPFALAKRKTQLTVPEKYFKALLHGFSLGLNALIVGVNALISVANLIIRTLNGIIKALKLVGIKVKWQIKTIPKLPYQNLGNLIENRIGMMKIETDFFSVPKVCLLDIASKDRNTKINSNNDNVLSARYLWLNFHYIESFVPTTDRPTANQSQIKDFTLTHFEFKDYQKVKNNNIILDANGQQVEYTSLRWNPYKQTAEIKGVRFPKLYTNNLTEKHIEASGS